MSILSNTIEHTDPEFVNFEFDSYWPTEAGVNVPSLMRRLGTRMKLWHINDRGTRISGPSITPILKSDCMELGYGNMDLEMLSRIALENKIDAVILEMHAPQFCGAFSTHFHPAVVRIYEQSFFAFCGRHFRVRLKSTPVF